MNWHSHLSLRIRSFAVARQTPRIKALSLTSGALVACTCLVVLCMSPAAAEKDEAAPPPPPEEASEPGASEDTPDADSSSPRQTDIEADTVDMNFAERTATFEGNVVVTDGNMTLKADRMTVHFSKEKELSTIKARGSVVILQPRENRRAEAGALLYDVEGILGIRHVEAMCAWAPGAREAGEMVACVVW